MGICMSLFFCSNTLGWKSANWPVYCVLGTSNTSTPTPQLQHTSPPSSPPPAPDSFSCTNHHNSLLPLAAAAAVAAVLEGEVVVVAPRY